MDLRGPIRRSTLAEANETRDWQIYAEFAQRLIAQARRLYTDDDLEVDLPRTVYAFDMLLPEQGAIYVMDRGYVDFACLHVLHEAGAFFVLRTKSDLSARRVYSTPADRSAGVICDQTIAMDRYLTQ